MRYVLAAVALSAVCCAGCGQPSAVDVRAAAATTAPDFSHVLATLTTDYPTDYDSAWQDDDGQYHVAFKKAAPDNAKKLLETHLAKDRITLHEHSGSSAADVAAASEVAIILASELWPDVELWTEAEHNDRVITLEVPTAALLEKPKTSNQHPILAATTQPVPLAELVTLKELAHGEYATALAHHKSVQINDVLTYQIRLKGI